METIYNMLTDIFSIMSDIGIIGNKINKRSVKYVPKTMDAICKIYMKGKNAVIPNMPYPEVIEISNHIYCIIIDVLKNTMGRGLDIDTLESSYSSNDDIDSTLKSALADNILTQVQSKFCYSDGIKIIPIKCWQDDFEPNTSIKTNRNIMRLKTVTLDIQSTKSSSSFYTFYISIGLKNESHEEVEKTFLEELLCLQQRNHKFYYCGNMK